MSYNNWMVKHQNHYLESSFTGQPITMYPPGVMGPPMKKPGLGYSQPPIVDDGPRKWTEKKKRSKSAPRGSELDELMGSSKAKPRSKFAAVTANVLPVLASAASGERRSVSPPPIRRQSRVELYENDRKRMKEKERTSLSGSIVKMINKFSSSQFVSRNIAGSTSALDTVATSPGEIRGAA